MKEIPGLYVPESFRKCMQAVYLAGNAQEEGIQIARELACKIKRYEGQASMICTSCQ